MEISFDASGAGQPEERQQGILSASPECPFFVYKHLNQTDK